VHHDIAPAGRNQQQHAQRTARPAIRQRPRGAPLERAIQMLARAHLIAGGLVHEPQAEQCGEELRFELQGGAVLRDGALDLAPFEQRLARFTWAIASSGWCVIAWMKNARALARSPASRSRMPRFVSAPRWCRRARVPQGRPARALPAQILERARTLETQFDGIRRERQPAFDVRELSAIAILPRGNPHRS